MDNKGEHLELLAKDNTSELYSTEVLHRPRTPGGLLTIPPPIEMRGALVESLGGAGEGIKFRC